MTSMNSFQNDLCNFLWKGFFELVTSHFFSEVRSYHTGSTGDNNHSSLFIDTFNKSIKTLWPHLRPEWWETSSDRLSISQIYLYSCMGVSDTLTSATSKELRHTQSNWLLTKTSRQEVCMCGSQHEGDDNGLFCFVFLRAVRMSFSSSTSTGFWLPLCSQHLKAPTPRATIGQCRPCHMMVLV